MLGKGSTGKEGKGRAGVMILLISQSADLRRRACYPGEGRGGGGEGRGGEGHIERGVAFQSDRSNQCTD